MTTINNIADLARILREQPEWAEAIRSLVLSQELLDLPERLSDFMALTNRNFELVHSRLDKLEMDVGTLKSDMVEVKNRTGNLETTMGQMQVSINQINGRLDNGFGMNYQFKVEKNLSSIASQHMNVRRVRVISGMQAGRSQEFVDLIEDAEDSGLITREQSEAIQRLDLVFRGQRRGDDTPTLVAAEVSITIGDSDIFRAAERSALLEMACGAVVLPAVVGSRIDEERTALAESHGVSVLITPDD